MKHPKQEEWIPYLYGDADPLVKKQLADHLNACPECAQELEGWRRSLGRLDAWKIPQRSRRRAPALNPALSLAAAALVVLAVGAGFGRWLSPAPDAGQLRAGLESSLKASLLPELREQVRRELSADLQARLDLVRQESTNALALTKAEAVDAAADTAQALDELLALVRSERAEDRQVVAGLIEEARKQHEADYVSLRKDLETVATTSDDRIRAAQLKLIELSSINPAVDDK